MATRAEAPHVEKDEHDQSKCSRGGWEARGPVGDAELLEEAHSTPVVEGGFFEPWFAIEDGSDCAAGDAVQRVANVFRAEATWNHFGVDVVASLGVRGEHLAGDLSVS